MRTFVLRHYFEDTRFIKVELRVLDCVFILSTYLEIMIDFDGDAHTITTVDENCEAWSEDSVIKGNYKLHYSSVVIS